MAIEIRSEPFQPWAELSAFESMRGELAGRFGASAVFVGSMRDFNQGDDVRGMQLEHYPGMTERELERICTDATARWSLLESLVIHRVGDLAPGDPIVLVAVWSAHRKEAFEACRAIMEALKTRAPFWKRERLESGSRWVESNTPGY